MTVETEVKGVSQSTNERGPSLVGSLGLLCQYKRFLFCLGCSSRPRTKYFFLTHHTLFQCLCPHHPGQAVVLGLLFLRMCLWCLPTFLLWSCPGIHWSAHLKKQLKFVIIFLFVNALIEVTISHEGAGLKQKILYS
jgi:hypothetical protein